MNPKIANGIGSQPYSGKPHIRSRDTVGKRSATATVMNAHPQGKKTALANSRQALRECKSLRHIASQVRSDSKSAGKRRTWLKTEDNAGTTKMLMTRTAQKVNAKLRDVQSCCLVRQQMYAATANRTPVKIHEGVSERYNSSRLPPDAYCL